jgi:hypothetical protein
MLHKKVESHFVLLSYVHISYHYVDWVVIFISR